MPAKNGIKRAKSAGFPKRDLDAISPAAGLMFQEGKFVGVDVPQAIEILASPETDLYGHKNVLFAGLKGWLLDSESLVASRYAIASSVAERITKLERSKAQVRVKPESALYGFKPKYRDFYERIYNQIGGMASIKQAFLQTPSIENSRRLAGKRIPHLIAMAKIWDFHVRELIPQGKQFGVPSVIKASTAAHWITRGEDSLAISHGSVWEYWGVHYRALPLLYAASLIKLDSGRTVLDLLLNNKLTLQRATPVFEQWFSYARYFTENVACLVRQRKSKRDMSTATKDASEPSYFPKIFVVEPNEPPAPLFDDVLKHKLADHIAKKKPSDRTVKHR